MSKSEIKIGLSKTSLVLGILSFLPWFLVLSGIPAIVAGHIARRRARSAPLQYGGLRMATAGLVLGYSSIVLTGFVLLQLARYDKKAKEVQCLSSLEELGVGIRMYAEKNDNTLPNELRDFAAEIRNLPQLLICPGDRFTLPATNFLTLALSNVSFEYLAPGLTNVAENTNVALMRCPIHNWVLLGNGSVVKQTSKIPRSQQRKNRPE